MALFSLVSPAAQGHGGSVRGLVSREQRSGLSRWPCRPAGPASTFPLYRIFAHLERAWRAVARPSAVGLALLLFAGTAAAQDATAPTVQRAAVNGATLTVTFDTTLEPAKDPAPVTTLRFSFSIPCGNANAHPNGVSVNGRIVTLALNSAVVPGAKVVLDYLPELTDDPLRAADDQVQGVSGQSGDARPGGAEVEQFLSQPVTNETPARRTMRGAAGFARADGQAVTNGTPAGPALRGTAESTSADGNGSTCPFKPSTDSDAPLTAAFHDVPAEHEGKGSEISFELRFSENFPGRLSYRKLRDEALRVTNGRVTGARRAAHGQNQRWIITVRPRSSDDVTVTLPAAEDCAATGAICTEAGRKLSNTTSATIATESGTPEPARFVSAATEPQGRGLILTFTKDIWVAGKHADYTVLVCGERRATRSAFWEDNTVGLVLTEPVRAGETVTVAYAKPSDGVKLHDTDELAVESFGPEAVANTVLRAANEPATGAPSITGAAQVGGTLTASTAEIADADGMTGAAFAFQWVSMDGTTDSDIAGATGSSYTLTPADEGRRIKVRVTFTDDAGHAETLVSAATAAVAARTLTASFTGVPAEHDGRSLFTFELRFSENFPGRFRHRVLRDEALQVTNGRVTQAKRVARGQNQRWTIKVRPASLEDVTVTLPAATDCAATGAVCTQAGRKLSNTVTATVRGPVALSVADARANEADEALAFTVSLSRAASGTVTVDYATRDGTATAGEDYTATGGTLSFAAGELEKTVNVPLLDDAIDEGEETFTLKLTNASGARIGDGEASGTIENADPLQKMWLSRFGRTVANHVTEAVSDRLAGPLTGAQVTVGGQSVDLARSEDEAWLGEAMTSVARALGASEGSGPKNDHGSGYRVGGWPGTDLGGSFAPSGAATRDVSGRELLLGSAFHLAREGDGTGPGLAAWGRVTAGGFDGEAPADAGAVRIDGEVTTGILGADAEWDRLLAGVAVSVSEGEGSFDQPGVDSGTVESTMTTMSPYARFMVTDRVSVWGLAGWGTGDMTIVQAANNQGQPERITRTDLSMRLGPWAAGARSWRRTKPPASTWRSRPMRSTWRPNRKRSRTRAIPRRMRAGCGSRWRGAGRSRWAAAEC